MSEDDDVTPRTGLVVDNIYQLLEPHLSARTKSVCTNRLVELRDDCFYFGVLIEGDITEEHYKNFATRLNAVCDKFNGFRRYLWNTRWISPRIEKSLSDPLRMPLAGGKHILTAYLYVEGIPTETNEDARVWLNDVLEKHEGEIMFASKLGELPK